MQLIWQANTYTTASVIAPIAIAIAKPLDTLSFVHREVCPVMTTDAIDESRFIVLKGGKEKCLENISNRKGNKIRKKKQNLKKRIYPFINCKN